MADNTTNNSSINPETALNVAGGVASLVVPKVANPVFLATSGVSGYIAGQNRIEGLAQDMGMTRAELEAVGGHSKAYKQFLNEAKNSAPESVKETAVSLAAGGAATAALGLVTLPAVPLLAVAAPIAVGLAGSVAGSWAYGKLKGQVSNEAFEAVQQIKAMQDAGQAVPVELVREALVQNLRNPRDINSIKSGMKSEQEVDIVLRAATEMPMDYATGKTVAEQYTDLINSKAINPYAVLLNQDYNTQLIEMIRQQHSKTSFVQRELQRRAMLNTQKGADPFSRN